MREADERQQMRVKKMEAVVAAAWRLRCSAASGHLGNIDAWEAMHVALDVLERFERPEVKAGHL